MLHPSCCCRDIVIYSSQADFIRALRQSGEIPGTHLIPVRLDVFRAVLRDVPLQDAGQISRNRGADSNPSLTALLHPIFLMEPEALLSADWLSCVFMPFRHSVSHNCSVMHNSLGEVPGIYPHAVLGSAAALKFFFILPKNMSYSITFVYYTIYFSVCCFCHGHLTT